MSDETWRRPDRFTEHPETVIGNVSKEFIDFLLHIHPDPPYDSATAALMCRQAYDIGRREERELKPNEHKIILHTLPDGLPTEEMLQNGRVSLITKNGEIMQPLNMYQGKASFIRTLRTTNIFTHWIEFPPTFPMF
jgi:hypothetical protein